MSAYTIPWRMDAYERSVDIDCTAPGKAVSRLGAVHADCFRVYSLAGATSILTRSILYSISHRTDENVCSVRGVITNSATNSPRSGKETDRAIIMYRQ